MEERRLKDIGFTEGEEKVYLALLRLGSSSSGRIAKEAGVSRSKLYEILEKLGRKGLVSHYKRNNISYFQAAHPRRILDFMEKREQELKIQHRSFEKAIPFFEGLIGQKELTKEAEVYEGMEGIKNVRETALKDMKPGSIMYYFGVPASAYEHMKGYWDDWNARRVKKKIYAWILYNQDAKTFGEIRRKMPFTKVKYFPKVGPSNAWIEIYGDRVAIAMKYQTPMSIVIDNKLVAESFKTYFNIFWDVALENI